MKRTLLIITACCCYLFFAGACSSSNVADSPKTADDAYALAMKEYNNKKYTEASKYFDIIKLQYPASSLADDAQYYLADINFQRKEYQLAAFAYNMLRRVYPRSEYSKEALFRTAICFYKLSGPYDREQDQTLKAIRQFGEFQATYPDDDSLCAQATNYIVELREKLGRREFFNGVVYEKMDYLKSALIYFNSVIDNYSDTKVVEDAYFEKLNVLCRMHKSEELKTALELFKSNFPKSLYLPKVGKIEQQLANGFK